MQLLKHSKAGLKIPDENVVNDVPFLKKLWLQKGLEFPNKSSTIEKLDRLTSHAPDICIIQLYFKTSHKQYLKFIHPSPLPQMF